MFGFVHLYSGQEVGSSLDLQRLKHMCKNQKCAWVSVLLPFLM